MVTSTTQPASEAERADGGGDQPRPADDEAAPPAPSAAPAGGGGGDAPAAKADDKSPGQDDGTPSQDSKATPASDAQPPEAAARKDDAAPPAAGPSKPEAVAEDHKAKAGGTEAPSNISKDITAKPSQGEAGDAPQADEPSPPKDEAADKKEVESIGKDAQPREDAIGVRSIPEGKAVQVKIIAEDADGSDKEDAEDEKPTKEGAKAEEPPKEGGDAQKTDEKASDGAKNKVAPDEKASDKESAVAPPEEGVSAKAEEEAKPDDEDAGAKAKAEEAKPDDQDAGAAEAKKDEPASASQDTDKSTAGNDAKSAAKDEQRASVASPRGKSFQRLSSSGSAGSVSKSKELLEENKAREAAAAKKDEGTPPPEAVEATEGTVSENKAEDKGSPAREASQAGTGEAAAPSPGVPAPARFRPKRPRRQSSHSLEGGGGAPPQRTESRDSQGSQGSRGGSLPKKKALAKRCDSQGSQSSPRPHPKRKGSQESAAKRSPKEARAGGAMPPVAQDPPLITPAAYHRKFCLPRRKKMMTMQLLMSMGMGNNQSSKSPGKKSPAGAVSKGQTSSMKSAMKGGGSGNVPASAGDLREEMLNQMMPGRLHSQGSRRSHPTPGSNASGRDMPRERPFPSVPFRDGPPPDAMTLEERMVENNKRRLMLDAAGRKDPPSGGAEGGPRMVMTGVPLRDREGSGGSEKGGPNRRRSSSGWDNMSLGSFGISPAPFKEVLTRENFFSKMPGMSPLDSNRHSVREMLLANDPEFKERMGKMSGMSGVSPGTADLELREMMMNRELMERMGRTMPGSSPLDGADGAEFRERMMANPEFRERMMMMNMMGGRGGGMMGGMMPPLTTPVTSNRPALGDPAHGGDDLAASSLGKRKQHPGSAGSGGGDQMFSPKSPTPKKSFLQRERIMDAEMKNHMREALAGFGKNMAERRSASATNTPVENVEGGAMMAAAADNIKRVKLPSLTSPDEATHQDGLLMSAMRSKKGDSPKSTKKAAKLEKKAGKKVKQSKAEKKKSKEAHMASILAAASMPDKPKRPFSAYNLFFQLEREFIMNELKEGRKPMEDPMIKAAMKRAEDGKTNNGDGKLEAENAEEKDKKDDDDNKPVLPPSSDGDKYFNDPNIPLRYKHLKLDKHWYSVGHKQKRKHRKTEGSCGFIELTKMVSSRWKCIDTSDPHVRKYCQKLADVELDTYKKAMEGYKRTVKKVEKEAKAKALMEASKDAEKAAEENLLKASKGKQFSPPSRGKEKKRPKKEKAKDTKSMMEESFTPKVAKPEYDMMMGDMARMTDFSRMSGPFPGALNTPRGDFMSGMCDDATPSGVASQGGGRASMGLPPPPFADGSMADARAAEAARMNEARLAVDARARIAARMAEEERASGARMAEARMAEARMGAELAEAHGAGGKSDIERKFAALAEAEARHRMQMEMQGGRQGYGMQRDMPGAASSDFVSPYHRKQLLGQGNFPTGAGGAGDAMSDALRMQMMEKFGGGMSGAGGRSMMPPAPGGNGSEDQFDMEVERFLSHLGKQMKENHRRNVMGGGSAGGGAGARDMASASAGLAGGFGAEGMGMRGASGMGGASVGGMMGMPTRAEMMAEIMMRERGGAATSDNKSLSGQDMMAQMMMMRNRGGAGGGADFSYPRPGMDGRPSGGDDDNPALPEYGWGRDAR